MNDTIYRGMRDLVYVLSEKQLTVTVPSTWN